MFIIFLIMTHFYNFNYDKFKYHLIKYGKINSAFELNQKNISQGYQFRRFYGIFKIQQSFPNIFFTLNDFWGQPLDDETFAFILLAFIQNLMRSDLRKINIR